MIYATTEAWLAAHPDHRIQMRKDGTIIAYDCLSGSGLTYELRLTKTGVIEVPSRDAAIEAQRLVFERADAAEQALHDEYDGMLPSLYPLAQRDRKLRELREAAVVTDAEAHKLVQLIGAMDPAFDKPNRRSTP